VSDAVPAALQVLRRSELRGPLRWVLAAIATFADPDGSNAFPSIERIAERAGMNEKTVRKYRSALLEQGELKIVGRRGKGGVCV
jgi:Helix-turn-helix domain